MENGRLCPASIMICIEAYKYVFRIIINMITYRSLRYRHSSFSLVVKLWAFYPGDKTLRLFIYQLLRRTVLADNLSVDKTREATQMLAFVFFNTKLQLLFCHSVHFVEWNLAVKSTNVQRQCVILNNRVIIVISASISESIHKIW